VALETSMLICNFAMHDFVKNDIYAPRESRCTTDTHQFLDKDAVYMANCWLGSHREINQTIAMAFPAVIGKVGQRRSRSSGLLRGSISM
jgi:hypothetical protein